MADGIGLRAFHEVVEGFWNRAFGAQTHETLKIVSTGGKSAALTWPRRVRLLSPLFPTSIPVENSSDSTACPAAAWSHGVRQQHPS
jgi:hypothetical protein